MYVPFDVILYRVTRHLQIKDLYIHIGKYMHIHMHKHTYRLQKDENNGENTPKSLPNETEQTNKQTHAHTQSGCAQPVVRMGITLTVFKS